MDGRLEIPQNVKSQSMSQIDERHHDIKNDRSNERHIEGRHDKEHRVERLLEKLQNVSNRTKEYNLVLINNQRKI